MNFTARFTLALLIMVVVLTAFVAGLGLVFGDWVVHSLNARENKILGYLLQGAAVVGLVLGLAS